MPTGKNIGRSGVDPSAARPAGGGPLRGLRVIDLGTMLAGPVACTLMADFGADVLKIEEPGHGDALRHIGPIVGDESLMWNVEARGKRSIAINLKRAEGREAFLKIVETADAVVENFRPGTLQKLGLDFETLRKANPDIVLLSVSGFGQTGPLAKRAGYDRIALAFGGLMEITGYPDRPPTKVGVSIADYQTALFGAFSLMMALYHRDASGGRGQHIDLALYESVYRFTDTLTTSYDLLGEVRQRQGNVGFAGAPGEHFLTRCGRYLILTISNTAMFRRLAQAMDRPDLAENPSYLTHELRWKHVHELNAIVAEWIKENDLTHVEQRLDQFGIAYGVTLRIDEICANEHYASRQNIQVVRHPRLGPIKMQGVGPKFSETPAPGLQPAPMLGEHTEEILRAAGMDENQIAALIASGVARSHPDDCRPRFPDDVRLPHTGHPTL